jgi:hypothetical protein
VPSAWRSQHYTDVLTALTHVGLGRNTLDLHSIFLTGERSGISACGE